MVKCSFFFDTRDLCVQKLRDRGARHGKAINNRQRPRVSSLELTRTDKLMAKVAAPLLILSAAILLRMDFLQPDNFLSSLLLVCFTGIVAIGHSCSQWIEVIDGGVGGDDDWLPEQPKDIGNRGRLLPVERAMETMHG